MLKPQDILVMLKVFVLEGSEYSEAELARSLDMNPAEIARSLKRLEAGILYSPYKPHIMRYGAFELLIYGARSLFPPEFGAVRQGIPTAHAGPLISDELLFNSDDIYVWPYPSGKSRGKSLKPIYKSVPYAAANDQRLYELLSFVDALRAGYARERNFAKRFLRERMTGGEPNL